jgi:uncharacterized protein YdbL (DUF1318 family)
MVIGRRWLLSLLAVLTVSCVTVNIYFPAAAIQKAADEIVEDVRQLPSAPPPAPAPDKTGRPGHVWLAALGPVPAHAAVDINVSTPAIRALKASMAGRFGQLKPLYDRGAIGEANNGLLAVREAGALNLRERADLNRLVEQENADRRSLYNEIIRANNLDPGTLGEVQRLFANSWRDKSGSGWWIQRDNGQWAKK